MVTVTASMFGGYKRTTESDITSAGGKLPETDILTKGGKHIFPTEKLAIFGTIKKDLFRQLWKFGVKAFGSGSVIAICADELDAAEKLLDKAQADFNAALSDLRLNYDMWLNSYINAQPNAAAADIIRCSALTRDDACSRFGFSFDTFMPTPVGKNGSVESMASKLTLQLYAEVAQTAADAYEQTFYPSDSQGARYLRTVGQRAKSKINACREKLSKLAFLHPEIIGAVEIIDRVLATTQQTGWILDEPSNPAAKRLLGLVELMKDAGNFAAAAGKIVSSSTPEDDIEIFCGIKSLWQPAEEVAANDELAKAVASIAANADEVSRSVNAVMQIQTKSPVQQPVVSTVADEAFFF